MVTDACFPRLAVFAALALSSCTEPTTLVSGSPSDAAARALDASAFAERDFVPRSDHRYFPLVPGTSFHYRSRTPDGIETEDFRVTTATKRILGVTTRVVEDVVRLDGSLTEQTFDWFAQDEEKGDVWYFGEDSRQFLDGKLIDTEGSWEAGRNGAQAGIIMEGHPKVGDTYREEFARGVAEDKARVLSLNASVHVPYGSFRRCLKTENFTPLDPGQREQKYYCPNVGLVREVIVAGGKGQNQLVRITRR